MKLESDSFDTPEELGAILDRIAKQYGLPDPGPCIGTVCIKYRIGPYHEVGWYGVFVGESPQEQVDEFIASTIPSCKRFNIAFQDPVFAQGDQYTIDKLKDIVENYSEKDVVLLGWEFTKEDD